MQTEKSWWFLDTLVIEHSVGGDRNVFVFEQLLPEGASPPLHVHHALDDSFFALEGKVVFRRGDEVFLAEPGRWVSVPSGTPHTFRVVGGPARILLVHDDSSFRDLVHDLGEPATQRVLPPSTGGPGLERLSRALVEHDSHVVGASMTEAEALAFVASPAGAVPIARSVVKAAAPDLHRRAAATFGTLVHSIRDDQWQLPTPCAAWDVRALVNHVVAENRWVPVLFAGRRVADVGDQLDGDLLGPDPQAAWDDSLAAAAEAINHDGAMVQTVHLSIGDVPGEEYVTQLVADVVVHAWDLARAIGGDENLDASLVQAAAAWFSGVVEFARQAGIVGPPLHVPDTADPQTKLLADLGRDASQPAQH
jgi:uncharacterized protein (TIGR03086 family)